MSHSSGEEDSDFSARVKRVIWKRYTMEPLPLNVLSRQREMPYRSINILPLCKGELRELLSVAAQVAMHLEVLSTSTFATANAYGLRTGTDHGFEAKVGQLLVGELVAGALPLADRALDPAR